MADDLTLRIGATAAEASKVLNQLSKDIKSLAGETKASSGGADAATSSFGKLAGAFAVGNLAAAAISKGLALVTSELKNSIDASNKYTSAMMGLSSVAGAFGVSQGAARDAAKSLAEDGLMTVTEAAGGLKNLLASGFGLDEAINLMNGFKDSAANNRQGSLEFGQAIVGATEGIKNQNSILVDNAGITKNLSVILKEQGLAVTDLQNVQSDASVRQKLYNGLLKETGIFSGDAARYTQTLAGQQSSLTAQVNNLRIQLGQALSPALQIIIGSLSDLAKAIGQSAGPHMKDLAILAVQLAATFSAAGSLILRTAQGLVSVFGGVAGAIMKMNQGNFKGAWGDLSNGIKGAGDAANGFMGDIENINERGTQQLANINKNGVGGITDIARNAIQQTGQAMSDAAKKVAESMAKENRDFQESLQKQDSQMQQSLKDMVIAHRDKTVQLQKDIADENADFDEKMTDRKRDFDKDMADIEKRHQDKVDTIAKQMQEEQRKISDAIDEITKKNKEPIEQFKIAASERLASLDQQLQEEKDKGDNANKTKVEKIQDMIAREKKSLDDQLQGRLATIEEDKQAAKDAGQQKIDDLTQQLTAEQAEYNSSLADKKVNYEEETAKILEEHSKRLNALQSELKTEMDLQTKYASDFAAFKDAVAEDDITRLKRTYAEQRAEMEREHQEKLGDIQRRSQEEAATKASGQISTNQAIASSISSSLAQSKNTTANKAVTLASGFTNGSSGGGGGGGGGSSWGGAPAKSTGVLQTIGSAISGAVSSIGKFFGFAEGGIVTMPTMGVIGEAGPEAIIPLSNPSRANEILDTLGGGRRGGGQTIINAPITVVSQEVDIDRLVERLAYQAKREGII